MEVYLPLPFVGSRCRMCRCGVVWWIVVCGTCVVCVYAERVCMVGGDGRYVCVFSSAVELLHPHVHTDSSVAILHLHFILSK